MSTGKHHATVLGGISWVYYGIYIWYLCYLEEVAHLRSDIYGVKWYLVFGIYGMYSNQYTPGNPLLCSISLFTKYMSWYAVLGYRCFLAAVIEQQHRPLQTHPVTLPLPARSQLQLPLPVNQPILDHQPSANITYIHKSGKSCSDCSCTSNRHYSWTLQKHKLHVNTQYSSMRLTLPFWWPHSVGDKLGLRPRSSCG